MHGILPEDLPPGATWVEPYDWGDDRDELPPTQPTTELAPGDIGATARVTTEPEVDS